MFRIIRELRPDWVVNENVTGTVSNLVLDQKAADLESVGYTCRAFAVPAVGVGACHLRERVFLIANADAQRREGALCYDGISLDKAFEKANPLDTQGNPFLRFTESVGEPAVFAVDDGIPGRVLRLGAAGDTVVSAIPVILLGAIREIERQIK
jgi:DNA (cytosine-5)-methyltransferase 1